MAGLFADGTSLVDCSPVVFNESPSPMQLQHLTACPALIPTLAQWHYAEWHPLFPHKSVEDFAADLRESLQQDGLPQTWVLMDEQSQPAGTASLLLSDMTTNQDLSPWLANIYIHPLQRGKGLGKQMVLHVMNEARQRGLSKLYLFTEDQQAFYQKLGWDLHHREFYENHWVAVMQYEFF
jgi:N-acetylglutamate synthase-like GNAT family acetyltransferase